MATLIKSTGERFCSLATRSTTALASSSIWIVKIMQTGYGNSSPGTGGTSGINCFNRSQPSPVARLARSSSRESLRVRATDRASASRGKIRQRKTAAFCGFLHLVRHINRDRAHRVAEWQTSIYYFGNSSPGIGERSGALSRKARKPLPSARAARLSR